MKVKSKVCSHCGCTLDVGNRSFVASSLCNACFNAEQAGLEAEDAIEDSPMTDDERLADFLGE